MKKTLLMIRSLFLVMALTISLNACSKKEVEVESSDVDEETVDLTGVDGLDEKTADSPHVDESEEETVNSIDVGESDEETADSLIASIENYGDKELFEKLYSMSTPCEDVPDWAGAWNRTNVHSSFSGVIDISDVDANGFRFTAEESYYSHSGWMEWDAKFVTDKCAIAKYDEWTEEEYIAFIIQDEGLVVIATGSSANLGFGMNVSIDGEYTKTEPFYTNADVLNETFSEEELSALQTHLPEEYYEDFFLFSTTNGVVTDTQSDNGDRTIESFVPTMGGYGYSLIISGEKEFTITFDDGESFNFSL